LKFEEKFNSFYPTLVAISKRYSAGTGIPVEEFISSLSEEFFKKFNNFNPDKKDNFTAYMRVILTQRATRVANRQERKFYDSIMYIEDGKKDKDGKTQELDFPSEWDLEEHVISLQTKKTDADKRELINALIEKSDSVTKLIVNEYLKSSDAPSPTGIGRKLGIHHQTVIRKLKYLSRNFSEREFGEIDDFLVV